MRAEHLEVRWRRPEELDARELQAWTGLESRAAEPNVYLSPHFVLPALRHLDASLRPVIAWIEAGTGAARELGGQGKLLALRRCVAEDRQYFFVEIGRAHV